MDQFINIFIQLLKASKWRLKKKAWQRVIVNQIGPIHQYFHSTSKGFNMTTKKQNYQLPFSNRIDRLHQFFHSTLKASKGRQRNRVVNLHFQRELGDFISSIKKYYLVIIERFCFQGTSIWNFYIHFKIIKIQYLNFVFNW